MKNISTYIIARINKKHSQNIEDTTSELFQQALAHCNAPTQLLIYRREALMYYLYVRKLNGTGDCFGMCAVVNSWMATDIPQLFGIFEEVFADVVAKGKILTLNKAGDIIANGEDLKQLPLETHQLSEQLRNKLSHYSAGTILPPADMSTNYGDFRQYELEKLTPEDIRQTPLHGWTAIYKREDYETEILSNYRTTIKSLHQENTKLNNEKEKLANENTKLTRQKKQMGIVATLLAIIIIGGIAVTSVIFNQKENIQNKEDKITRQQNTIQNQNVNIASLQEANNFKQFKINELEGQVSMQQDTIREQKETIGLLSPFMESYYELQADFQKIKNERDYYYNYYLNN